MLWFFVCNYYQIKIKNISTKFQERMLNYFAVGKEHKKRIQKQAKIKNIPKCPPRLGGRVTGVKFVYVRDYLSNASKIDMQSFRKNIQSFSKDCGTSSETDKQTNWNRQTNLIEQLTTSYNPQIWLWPTLRFNYIWQTSF